MLIQFRWNPHFFHFFSFFFFVCWYFGLLLRYNKSCALTSVVAFVILIFVLRMFLSYLNFLSSSNILCTNDFSLFPFVLPFLYTGSSWLWFVWYDMKGNGDPYCIVAFTCFETLACFSLIVFFVFHFFLFSSSSFFYIPFSVSFVKSF